MTTEEQTSPGLTGGTDVYVPDADDNGEREPTEAELAAAEVERVHMEARAALDEAGIPRSADAILWLAEVSANPKLKKLEGVDLVKLKRDIAEAAKEAKAKKAAAERKAAEEA